MDKNSIRDLFTDEQYETYKRIYPAAFDYIEKGGLVDEYRKYIERYGMPTFDPNNRPLDPERSILSQLMEHFNNFFMDSVRYERSISNRAQLLAYEVGLFKLDAKQEWLIELFGLDNIKRFEEETGLFSNGTSERVQMFEAFANFFYPFTRNSLNPHVLSEKNQDEDIEEFSSGLNPRTMAYEEFKNKIAQALDIMRRHNVFQNYPNYDMVQGEFREQHPEIFMSNDAPLDLREIFYKNNIRLKNLWDHRDDIKYLVDKDLTTLFRKTRITLVSPVARVFNDKGMVGTELVHQDFITEYVKRYGNEKTLKLLAKYGPILHGISITNLNNEIDNEQAIEDAIIKAIYDQIITGNPRTPGTVSHKYLIDVPEFYNAHPEVFIDTKKYPNIPKEIINKFYCRTLSFEDFRECPILAEALKDKDLRVPFCKTKITEVDWSHKILPDNEFDAYFSFGQDMFIKLCLKYGGYLNYLIYNHCFTDYKEITKDNIESIIEEQIIKGCKNGSLPYSPETAPEFLKKQCPELFLDEDAPELLRKYFYNVHNMMECITFTMLKNHPEWLPYLNEETIRLAIIKRSSLTRIEALKYFTFLGTKVGIKLGMEKPEIIDYMIDNGKTQLVKEWYDLTGHKFIPNIAVMLNVISNEDRNRFLLNASNWSNLMKITEFTANTEANEAMLKLAFVFGVFDGDQRGLKKLQELLTSVPKNIKKNIIDDLCDEYHRPALRLNNTSRKIYDDLINAANEEKVNLNPKENVFTQIYKENEDGSYTLAVNPRSCPKTIHALKMILGEYDELDIVTADKAHKLFGGFNFEYDPDFREFLLDNINKILVDPNYIAHVANVQRQFKEIKITNSNRKLTWDLAIDYVKSNAYANIDVGNNYVATVSSIAGYSQQDFNALQEIYNYGKQRTFSSIPRIKNSANGYSYEILRLDDPLAMTIGILSDCCQKLGDAAESCMIHSMVDKNGRVFVIKDDQGNIVAQSWIWRNKDTICFDNIEIPGRAFRRVKGTDINLAEEVYHIYEKAAEELIEEDERVYKELLDSGKITQEQYDGLRLGKVTTGLGYNDIATVILHSAERDNKPVHPLIFNNPVNPEDNYLYTNDSKTQYILKERDDRKEISEEALPLYGDEFIEYDDSNIDMDAISTLLKLERISSNSNLISSAIDYSEDNAYIEEIADNYNLDPETTKIVMNPNFAIIYDNKNNKVRIAELMYNPTVTIGGEQLNIEKVALLQMKLALLQISKGKDIDISLLNSDKTNLYNTIQNISDEIDIERGVGNVK